MPLNPFTKKIPGILVLAFLPVALFAQPAADHRVHSLKIRILSTMLADTGLGEWGFSALVEADGHPILFDTGFKPDTVLKNAEELKVDLSQVEEVILSHNHDDHTGGLITLRRAMMAKNPAALSRAHVGQGIFLSRRSRSHPGESNTMLQTRGQYEAIGGHIIVHDQPVELYPGVWLTGPVPRKYPEKNWSPGLTIVTATGEQEDTIPEDQSLVFNTDQGLILLSGCGHAGIVNTLEYARSTVRNAPVYAAIGGFHLFRMDDRGLAWTADHLREFGVQNFMGAHCTGIEAVYRIRQLLGLERHTASVGAVGGVFELGKPMDPGEIAR